MIAPLEELVEAFCRLPTIGRKSAWRLALHLMEQPESESLHLAETLTSARTRLHHCARCFNYSEEELCSICASTSRNQTCICVVEKPVDAFAMERSGRFKGVYHILGGVLSPLNGITVEKLHILALKDRINNEHPDEVILALGGTADAETTALFIARLLAAENVRLTRLARGLPAGMELEFADQVTLSQALNERTDIHYGSKNS